MPVTRAIPETGLRLVAEQAPQPALGGAGLTPAADAGSARSSA